MSGNGVFQILLYFGVLTALAWPLGGFIARVYLGERTFLSPVLGPVERLIYRLAGVRTDDEMDWKRYAVAVIWFSLIGVLFVYALQRLQGFLPLNPQDLGAVSPDSSFNTAVSFVTNTNWQGYGGESTMSYLSQMLGLAVQNFVSAASGIAVLAAFIRGFVRKKMGTVGNFWVDLTRSTLYVLLPISTVLALVLVSQGVVQNFSPAVEVPLDAIGRSDDASERRRARKEPKRSRPSRCRRARQRRRSRSSSSAPTAADSSTSTRRIRTRTRRRFPTSSRCWRSC